MRNSIIAILLLLVGLTSTGSARDHLSHVTIDSTIIRSIWAHFGCNCPVSVKVLDSLIGGKDGWGSEEITDPFGTLQHCVLFFAINDSTPDSTAIGIWKEGEVIWSTSFRVYGLPDHILGTKDINNDGKVDLMIKMWSNGPSFLWIFSWDGIQGQCLNSTDTTVVGIMSRLKGDDFETIDGNNDGIYEICAWYENKIVTHSWNGTEYGPWIDEDQYPDSVFLPANNLKTSVLCSVAIDSGNYTYVYTVHNHDSSKQLVCDFFLEGISRLCEADSPEGWYSGLWKNWDVMQWTTLSSIGYTIPRKGQLTYFGLTSLARPTIVRYFVQGCRPIAGVQDITPGMLYSEMHTNSISGYTIGPTPIPDSIEGLYLVDTLKHYSMIADSLHWITDRSRYRSYSRHLESAKTSLAGKDSVAARSELEKMLGEVLSNTASLTSEGYALLRYNLEYIIGKLPKKD